MDAYVLDVRGPAEAGRIVPLPPRPFWIGRDRTNDLALPDPVVSRRHCVLEAEAGRVVVRDNDSHNGVVVAGERVEGRRVLEPDDVLSIGPYRIRLSLTARPRGQPGPDPTVSYFPSSSTEGLRAVTSRLGERPGERHVPWERLLRLLAAGSTAEMYELVLQSVEQLVEFDRCFLIRPVAGDDSFENLEILARRQRGGAGGRDTSRVYVSHEILRRVVRTGEGVSVHSGEPSFTPSSSFVLSGARSVLCLPLAADGGVPGVLYLDRMIDDRPFAGSDQRALAPLAALVALKLENQRLLEAQVQRHVDERELEIAKEVQRRFLPLRRIEVPGWSVDAVADPCRDVGGDCLDLVMRDGSLWFLVGDVTGKGLPAALYMTGLVSVFHAWVAEGCSLEEILPKLAAWTDERFRPEHFLTVVVGRLDPASGEVRWANAGHPPPIIVTAAGPAEEIEDRSPALHIVPWHECPVVTRVLETGDLFAVYTDGLTEEEDAGGTEFGKARLIEWLEKSRGQGLCALRSGLLARVEAHGGGPGLHDDATLLLLRREPAPQAGDGEPAPSDGAG